MGEPDAEVISKVDAIQAETPCRKCKAKTWKRLPEYGSVSGGQRVGVFVALVPSRETVLVATYVCQGCHAKFARPIYTPKQLAAQQFPSVQLDVRTEPADEPPT